MASCFIKVFKFKDIVNGVPYNMTVERLSVDRL